MNDNRVKLDLEPGFYLTYKEAPNRPSTKGGRTIAHYRRFETRELAQNYLDHMGDETKSKCNFNDFLHVVEVKEPDSQVPGQEAAR